VKRLTIIMLLIASACTAREPNYEAEGATLKVALGDAPKEVRTAAAKILDRCGVPIDAVTLFPPHETWAPAWSIQLPASLAIPKITSCIDHEAGQLKLDSKITWGEAPPPAPPVAEMKEEYLLIAAERRVPDPADVPPIPDAGVLLPKVLHSCGIDRFQQEDITDGIVALRFTVTPRERTDGISCVQREQPHGAWVEPAD
jgi:hypothetical protein